MTASLPIAAVGLAAMVAAAPASAIFSWPSLTFSVGSQSMAPGLTVGDIILFPPMFAAAPRRGDVVVHRGEIGGSSVIFIKRIVGLPGDRVRYVDGVLMLNGEIVPRERTGEIDDPSPGGFAGVVYRESLDGASYAILESSDDGLLDNTSETTVPAGSYFGLGDNRDNSVDSRLPEQGPIAAGSIIGRACLRYRFPVSFTYGCGR